MREAPPLGLQGHTVKLRFLLKSDLVFAGRGERRKPKDANCVDKVESSAVAKVSQGTSRLVLSEASLGRDQ